MGRKQTPQMRIYESYEALGKVLRIHLENSDKTNEYLVSSGIFNKIEEDNGLENAIKNSEAILAGLKWALRIFLCFLSLAYNHSIPKMSSPPI